MSHKPQVQLLNLSGKHRVQMNLPINHDEKIACTYCSELHHRNKRNAKHNWSAFANRAI
jgi:hypothetical protein